MKSEEESYRPVANLFVIEKVVKEYMKQEISEYFENNNILLQNHHGGRRLHSTITTRTITDQKCAKAHKKKIN